LLVAFISPLTLVPALFVPLYVYTGISLSSSV
jgi:hypothetical protein